jgi:hypothetical protein
MAASLDDALARGDRQTAGDGVCGGRSKLGGDAADGGAGTDVELLVQVAGTTAFDQRACGLEVAAGQGQHLAARQAQQLASLGFWQAQVKRGLLHPAPSCGTNDAMLCQSSLKRAVRQILLE